MLSAARSQSGKLENYLNAPLKARHCAVIEVWGSRGRAGAFFAKRVAGGGYISMSEASAEALSVGTTASVAKWWHARV